MDVKELIWQYVLLVDVLLGTAAGDIVMVFHKSINLTKATSVTLYGNMVYNTRAIRKIQHLILRLHFAEAERQ